MGDYSYSTSNVLDLRSGGSLPASSPFGDNEHAQLCTRMEIREWGALLGTPVSLRCIQIQILILGSDSHPGILRKEVIITLFTQCFWLAAIVQKLGDVFLSQSISSSQVPPQSVNFSKIQGNIYWLFFDSPASRRTDGWAKAAGRSLCKTKKVFVFKTNFSNTRIFVKHAFSSPNTLFISVQVLWMTCRWRNFKIN